MFLKKFFGGFYKGATKKRGAIFQTVDVGSGTGEWVRKQAERFPSRTYVATDPLYSLGKRVPTVRELVKGLSKKGVRVEPKTLTGFLKTMIKRKQKARNFNIDMPTHPFELYNFEFLFENISRVLFPNGKIFVKSEMHTKLRKLRELAKRYSLRVSAIKSLPRIPVESLRTGAMKLIAEDSIQSPEKKTYQIYSLVITYGLKKARKDFDNQR